MAARRLTSKQAADLRAKEAAKAKAVAKAAKPTDKLGRVLKEIAAAMGGDGFVMRGSDVRQQVSKRWQSGIPALDFVLAGGAPEGTLIELGGRYSSGKTTSAIKILREAQMREWAKPARDRRPQGWVALEPFSKTWARELGLWIPFNEAEIVDPETGELKPMDPFAAATRTELARMAELGIDDPYCEITPFVVVSSMLGDKALDAALEMLQSNLFTHIVVDSLATAKSTKWLLEKDVQSAADFARDPMMLSNYTARALAFMNVRFDENGEPSNDGVQRNRTTLIHLNQVISKPNSQAHVEWKTHEMKGGEGIKHNHHAVVFIEKKRQLEAERPTDKSRFFYGQTVQYTCLKSKIGPPFRQAEIDFYFDDFGGMRKGDYDVAKCVRDLGVALAIVAKEGNYLEFAGLKVLGRDNFLDALRLPENEPVLSQLVEAVRLGSLAQ